MRTRLRLGLSAALLFSSVPGSAGAQSPAPPELEEGQRLLKERRYEDALRTLRAAAEKSPERAEVWVGLGNANLAMQRHAEAVSAFERALGLEPAGDTVRYNLAFALRKAGRPRDAAEAYRRYLEVQPNDPDAYYGLAEALREARDALGAAAAYEAYAKRESRPDRAAWIEKAEKQAAALRAYAGEGDPSPRPQDASPPTAGAAPTAAASAAAPNPAGAPSEPAPAALAAVRAALSAGRFELARDQLLRLPERERSTLHVAAAFAAAHLGLGEAEAAIAWYRRALAMAPDAAKGALLFGLAEAHRRDGNAPAAQEALRAVLARGDPSLAPAARERLAVLEAR